MKKYRQILAGFLSMSLIINTMTAAAAEAGVSLAAEHVSAEDFQAAENEVTEEAVPVAEEMPTGEIADEPSAEMEDGVGSDSEIAIDDVVVEPSAPVTEAPVTEAPVTEAPVTEAPVTEAPVTEAPVTEAPVTEAPVTEAPVTEAPVTEVPVTEAPVTEAPATEAPETEGPETETQQETEETETETETESESETESPIALYSAYVPFDGTLKLENFDYNEDTKTVTVTTGEELILLSHCDAESLQDVTVNINTTGDFDITGTATPEKDLPKQPSGQQAINLGTIQEWNEDETKPTAEEQSGNSAGQEETVIDTGAVVVSHGNAAPDDGEVILDEENRQEETAVMDGKTEPAGGGSDGFILDITVEDGGDGAVISNGEPEAQILTGEALKAAAVQEYTYQGLGTEAWPFRGKITGEDVTFKINQPLFKVLSSKATLETKNEKKRLLTWGGTDKLPMLAETYRFETDEQKEFEFPAGFKADSGTDVVMGSMIGTVDGNADGVLVIGNEVTYGTANTGVTSTDGNGGLICDTLKSGAIRLNGYAFPESSCTIQSNVEYRAADSSNAGNAGALIGVMQENTALQISQPLSNTKTKGTNTTTTKLTVLAAGNAGGLIGKMESGARICTGENAAVSLKEVSVTGSVSAGGVAGESQNALFDSDDLKADITVETPSLKGEKSGANVGGFIGIYTLNGAENDKVTAALSEKIKITAPDLFIAGEQKEGGGNAGGYFGLLELKGQASYTIGSEEGNRKFDVSYDKNTAGGNAWSYGGLIGQTTAEIAASTLKIQNITVKSTFPVYRTDTKRPQYYGGLIGCVGDGSVTSYVEVENAAVTAGNPHATFGGAAGVLAGKSILSVEKITVTTESAGQDAKIWDGGGVLGEAKAGSVLQLSGTTDLTKVSYEKNNNRAAQLVGVNENALIYAMGSGNDAGWTYKRSDFKTSNGSMYNDLLCYGQVIRLGEKLSKDLITIGTDHKVTLKSLGSRTESAVTVNSADEFAVLSIAWNTRGCFGSESRITTKNWSSIKNSTITIAADIDLSGTGITGLSRDTDTDTDDDTFQGILTGGGEQHKITLGVGETYGVQGSIKPADNTAGCGIVYAVNDYHKSQGLFARVDQAVVTNILLDGSIHISNEYSNITAGGIAGYMHGGNGEDTAVKLNNVTAQEAIYARGAAQREMTVGGLFGTEAGGWLRLEGHTTAAPKIKLAQVGTNGPWVCGGGILGKASTSGFRLQLADAAAGNGASDNEQSYITTDATNYGYIGGLIGLIATENNEHWIEIYSLTMDGLRIQADNAANASGGLFGSIWENVGVYFMGNGTETNAMLTVKNCTVSAGKAGLGGLAYRSSGVWEIRDYGIDVQSLSVSSGWDVGLLVCQGEKGKTLINQLVEDKPANAAMWENMGALYLKTTAYWETSYKLANVSVNCGGVFDEFVAHTTPTAKEIMDNGKNGVVSIATRSDGTGRVGVAESGTNSTTYQNRTEYGKTHQTNGCSRYYYDLDQCLKEASEDTDHNNNQHIDTPQELLLWSVYNYACSNIKKYITQKSEDGKSTVLYSAPDSSKKKDNRWFIMAQTGDITLDMKKYSYYPVSIGDCSINFMNATLTFYNEQIETAERTAGKSTKGNADNHTQHYAMHCGLLYTYAAPSATLTASKVTFTGSVGMVGSGSGALIANKATGYLGSDKPRYVAVSVLDSKVENLKITDCGEGYAPLLINVVGNYTTLNVKGLSAEYDPQGTAVASSLVGVAGDQKAKQINLAFERIVLPDKKADGTSGIFSHATLLESFIHDGTSSGATYNFVKSEDWQGTNHIHHVTYGKEITETKEYQGLQLWYYDEAGYRTDNNLVQESAGQTDFSAKDYLPYVCEEYKDNGYNHEIKVNQRMDNIVNGCGTYGHPYVITSEREMQILAAYMAGGKAPQGWCITITGNQSENHAVNGDYDSDVTYKYKDGEGWIKVKKQKDASSENWMPETGAAALKDDVMREYLLNAYYDLQGTEQNGTYTLELNGFSGFGNEFQPFRGVLTSTRGTTVVLQGTVPANGLIGYSYGCVVKNLTVSYEKCEPASLSYTASNYYSRSVFGGVIGCVLGGDNIIDSVSVKYGSSFLSLEGTKSHLIPVGGYVGEISGGGVLFRNLTDRTGLAYSNVSGSSENTWYVNPYVGRVLDGFAFYEVTKTGTDAGSVTAALDNTSKNYQINTLSGQDAGCVAVTASGTDQIVTIANAKGLLVLSAIVNSGAAAGGKSKAYSNAANTGSATVNNVAYGFAGAYGKVRNASYDSVGSTKNSEDFNLSVADDQTVPGEKSLPYLVKKYCGGSAQIFSASGESGLKIALKENSDYDMTLFGSGYQGIGARYASNAVLNTENNSYPNGLVPEIRSFDGKGNTITVNMPVKEYSDDDFRAPSVGGVLNELRVGTAGCTVSNLTITGQQSKKSEVSLKYYGTDGKETVKASKIVDAGGFAGTVSRISNVNANANARLTFDTINVRNLAVCAPRNAGGLLGSSTTKNMTDPSAAEEVLIDGSSHIGVLLKDTCYSGLTVSAPVSAGGFVGFINNKAVSSFCVTKGDETGGEDKVVGADSEITSTTTNSSSAKDSSTGAGGVFGYVKAGSVYLNAPNETGTAAYKNAVMQNIAVIANQYAGGFIGKIDQSPYTISQAKAERTGSSEAKIATKVEKSDNYYTNAGKMEGAGGIVGYARGKNSKNSISACSVSNIQINLPGNATAVTNESKEGAGGIVGLASEGAVTIQSCQMNSSKIYGAVSGGIAGTALVAITFDDCKASGESKTSKSEVKGYCTASGILGYWQSGGTATIQGCSVRYLDIEGKHWGVGALIGDDHGSGTSLCLYDTYVLSSSVKAGDGTYYQAGGIIGNLRSDLIASNLLFSDVAVEMTANDSHCAGLLIGNLNKEKKKIRIAGLSIQNIPTESKGLGLIGNEKAENYETYRYTGYIAFADYSGAALSVLNADGTNGSTAAVRPYVVTSPESALSVYKTENDTAAKDLYGDGAYWTGTTAYTVQAKTIWDEKEKENGEHYRYSAAGVDEFEFSSAFSTYNANQSTKAKEDFPVLQLSGGDAGEVSDYLDILTNGGFSAANEINSSGDVHVTAKTEVYTYKNDKFIKAVNEDGSDVTPALRVKTDTSGLITFLTTTDYDNTKDRFTLLTVTFQESGHAYDVFVPVLVRRMLEIDFSATLSYGTNYRSTNYEKLTSHVLESFGSPISAYLTYRYNSKEGAYMDYGWESYINDGGNVAQSIGKTLVFKQNTSKIPMGTQLTLIDCQNGNRAYYHTVTEEESEKNTIALDSFLDSDKKAYVSQSIAEMLDIQMEKNSDGTFIQVDQNGVPVSAAATATYPAPTIKVKAEGKDVYYRLAQDGEEGDRYRAVLDETSFNKGGKSTLSESYYLVITVPAESAAGAMNGSLETDVTDSIPHQLHYRTIQGGADNHSSTASTYQISKGYQQTLEEGTITQISGTTKKLSADDNKVEVDVVDKITFPNGQAYQKQDNLFLQIVGNLQKTLNTNGAETTTAEQFPQGTTGLVKFYVYKNDTKTYYTWNNGTWSASDTEASALEYTWTSNGGMMTLPLSTDGTAEHAVSLQGVRDLVSTGNQGEESTFYVEAKLTAQIPVAGLEVIPEAKSEGTPENYAKLVYTSQLSTERQSLSYSNNRASCQKTKVSYYRNAPVGATMTYEADRIDQLGINRLDLRYLDASGEHAMIDTTAVYDLSAMQNLKDTLASSNGVQFTLQLQQKNTSGTTGREDYQDTSLAIADYLSVELTGDSAGTVPQQNENHSFIWTVPKSAYYNEESQTLTIGKIFNGTSFTQAIRLLVNVDNTETASHFYSNYKVVLTAKLLSSNGTEISDTTGADYIIYTLANIKTEFVDNTANSGS